MQRKVAFERQTIAKRSATLFRLTTPGRIVRMREEVTCCAARAMRTLINIQSSAISGLRGR